MRTYLIAGVVILGAVFAGYFLVTHNNSRPAVTLASSTLQYSSPAYGFTFTYPKSAELREVSAIEWNIGTTTAGLFDELTQMTIVTATSSRSTLSDLAHSAARARCAQQYPDARCNAVSRTDSFAGASGAGGEVFYLEYESTDSATRASTTREAGPFYAFDITPSTARSMKRALLIYPAHFAEESVDYDTGAGLANLIAETLRLAQ